MKNPSPTLPVALPPTSLKQDLRAIGILLLLCSLAYWPLTFHVLSLKNDALNYFLPVRFQVSEAISHHQYPFWSPYLNLGYPLHGDMQSGVWNPIVQFFSLFGPYTLYTLQIETLLYIFLSGIGMYFLVQQGRVHWYAALFAAAAYMLCGFNSDCCQYLNWISGAAFLPFVVLFIYKTLKKRHLPNALAAGFFLYLQFVCAYPAQFIMTLYLLLAIFLYYIILQHRHPAAPSRTEIRTRILSLLGVLKKSILLLLPAIACFILLSLPAILSYSQYLPLSERGNGTTYENAMSNSLHPLLLFAWLTPLPVYKDLPFADTVDNLQRNSYFGIITFVFTLSSFFIKTSDPRVKFCRVAVLVFMIMSLGQFGGLRPLSYYLLPLMNTFRHPAGIKLFTTFFSCILAAWCLDRYSSALSGIAHPQAPLPDTGSRPDAQFPDVPTLTARLKKAALCCGAILVILFLISLSRIPEAAQKVRDLLTTGGLQGISARAAALKKVIAEFSFKEMLLVDTLIQLPFIALLLFYLRKRNYKALVYLNMANCVLHIMLFTPFTVVKKDTAATIQRILNKAIVKGYPLPSLETSLQDNSALDSSRFEEIGCLNMYSKQVGRNDYRISPSNLLSQNEFWFDTALRRTVMQYPLLYKPDTIIAPPVSPLPPERKIAVLPEYYRKMKIGGRQPKEDYQLSVTAFTPNHFSFTSQSEKPAFYVLLQNYYPLWRLTIDGKEQPIIRSNFSFMGLEIPAGSHRIDFTYQARHIAMTWGINILLTVFLLGLFCWQYFRRYSKDPFAPSR